MASKAISLIKPDGAIAHSLRRPIEVNGGKHIPTADGDQGGILRKDGKDCVTPFDAIPFAATTPVPVTHRFFGRSIADLVMPQQREKTALKRGALDDLSSATIASKILYGMMRQIVTLPQRATRAPRTFSIWERTATHRNQLAQRQRQR